MEELDEQWNERMEEIEKPEKEKRRVITIPNLPPRGENALAPTLGTLIPVIGASGFTAAVTTGGTIVVVASFGGYWNDLKEELKYQMVGMQKSQPVNKNEKSQPECRKSCAERTSNMEHSRSKEKSVTAGEMAAESYIPFLEKSGERKWLEEAGRGRAAGWNGLLCPAKQSREQGESTGTLSWRHGSARQLLQAKRKPTGGRECHVNFG
ncbi:hypothetical protein LR48_Vigan09g084800 [Vigna angularis]|uniref:Uncharacterized protein n=1 Tax=Phaseolus angularis TaxID=3914 RepID=A0A0L9VC01_PHAAN|nr:hypothetical protein LR48_Vigan09g084800 [Vigna angularis]